MSECRTVCNLTPLPIVPYGAFTAFTPTVPKLYWDVKSQEQRIKSICCELEKLIAYADALGVQININAQDIQDLKDQFEKFMESGFFDYYAEQIEQWIKDNMERIIKAAVKMVFFGLTRDDECGGHGGYFCAYIPSSWSEIQFDTGAIYGTEEYGRLILRYCVDDGSGVIDNTGHEWDDPKLLTEIVAQVNGNSDLVLKHEHTLYDPMEDTDGTR